MVRPSAWLEQLLMIHTRGTRTWLEQLLMIHTRGSRIHWLGLSEGRLYEGLKKQALIAVYCMLDI
jgi:hypothetical protein